MFKDISWDICKNLNSICFISKLSPSAQCQLATSPQFWQVTQSPIALSSVCLFVCLYVLDAITHERFEISSPNCINRCKLDLR